ncbi:ATP-binding cassette alpha-factor transporter STE6 [Sugiyamaella lignohabitans]|uniref:ATP-binding cassette alpha-factor transporter STE6 n=1 Tax=Sugiyamaella lignohabitans TaxID=796027 RepID=A0A161HLQ6_9ASCO|nr:ATP-binding cassette alpha-factor transporter STE6 [Sugiyamaella lignohabitans]ANB14367.1 ATP-binding cassette alpha-factor transporter STE6 [Sugiyamaella lignohabitans]
MSEEKDFSVSSPDGSSSRGSDSRVDNEKAVAVAAAADRQQHQQQLHQNQKKKGLFGLFGKKKADNDSVVTSKSSKAKDKEEDPFHNFSEHDAKILRDQIQSPEPSVSLKTLYRYANKKDVAILILGYGCSIVAGAALPMFTLVFGNLTQEFSAFFTGENPDPEKFQAGINHNTLYFLYLGIGIIVFSFVDTYIHVERGEVLTARIRQQYLKAILRQNIAYFDKLGAGEVTTRITNDTNAIQEGISEKAGLIVSGLSTFVAALVIAFVRSWRLALILLSVVVAITGSMVMGSVFVIKFTGMSTSAYGKGATVAEEGLSAIRNTVAFGAQNRLAEKFDVHLAETMKYGIFKERSVTVMVACLWSVIYLSYALSFWEGSRFIVQGHMQVGSVITVIMAMMIGAFQLGHVAPSFQSISVALSSAKKIFEAIDRVPTIDSESEKGEVLDEVQGHIQLKNVKFVYPSRPDVTVLHDMNLEVKPGQTVALVGMSGSGKSTIIGLLERFYKPLSGSITIDGKEIDTLNVKWLRQQIALVSQEPTLFAVTIYENICFGLIGTPYEDAPEDKKRELVVEACKQANAWEFIQNMTDGLDTNVGDRGFLMSGGQKQRIAIARAIISNPKILLLDEATSALDTKSEGIVQEALDRASKERTTIVIAHRLSTIKDADKIVVMSRGDIVEQGTHQELVAMGGVYQRLVEAQRITAAIKQEQEEGTDVLNDSDLDSQAPHKYIPDEDEEPLKKVGTTKSISSDIIANQKHDTKKVKRNVIQLISMLLTFNREEKWFMIIGATASSIAGFGYPALSMLFAKIIQALMVTPDHYGEMRHQVNVFTGYFFMIGIIMFGVFIVMIGCLSYASQKLVRKIRLLVFRQYMRMDIEFFDRDENSTGALTSTLAKDAQAVEGFGGATLGQVLQSIITLFGGIIVAIAFNWRLGLVCTACVPILVGCGFMRMYVMIQLSERAKKVYEDSGAYACESISAVRTVASLTREHGVWRTYADAVESQVKRSRPAIARSALMFALSQGLTPWVMGLGFWYGSTLLKTFTISSFQFFVAFTAVVFGAQAAGSIFSYAPDMGKARQATGNVAEILDVTPKIDTWSNEGEVLDPAAVEGNVEFRGVHFRYPTRPEVPVLRGLNLTVKTGQYVALVGASGCGKSTTIGLIERFYSPLAGQVLLDGHDISELNVNEYRNHISLVQQEPVLYSGTIRENIMLGTKDGQEATEEEMYAAARKANIHDFVMSLPDGYETFAGSKGALLSGGQKQRIAIARALIRNPKVLLLDEATSALDSESEKVVQQALDEAAKGRTTIAVAHRLSTIQNADIIYVFDEGRILEAGTHQQLLANRSRYFELVQMQSLDA